MKKLTPVKPVYRVPVGGMTLGSFLLGFFSRTMIAALGGAATALFWGDAMRMISLGSSGAPSSVSSAAVIFLAILTALIVAFSSLSRKTRVSVPLGAGLLYAVIVTLVNGSPLVFWEATRCFINSSLLNLSRISAAFSNFPDYLIGKDSYGFGGSASLLPLFFAVFTILVTVLYSVLIIQTVRVIPLSVSVVLLTVPVFILNVTRTNFGFSLIIPFIAGVVALWICDRRYLGAKDRAVRRREARIAKRAAKREKKRLRRMEKQQRRHDAAVAYYDVLDAGGKKKDARRARHRVLHKEKIEARERRKAVRLEKRLARKEAKKQKKQLTRITKNARRAEKKAVKKLAPAIRRQEKKAVRLTAKAAAAAKKRAASESRKAAKAAKAAERRRARAAKIAEDEKKRAYRRRIAAGGGFAGFISALLSLIVASIIAVTCESFAPVIPPIYDPISALNEEITAWISGGDIDLNELAKHITVPDLHDRKISFDPVVEWQKPFLELTSSVRMPIYLRHWTSYEYDLAADTWRGYATDLVDKYREMFGKTFTPDELRTNYYHYLYPAATEVTEFGLSRSFYEAAFATAFVTVTRVDGSDYLLYVPAYLDTGLNFLDGVSLRASAKKCSRYFDGIYSSRNYREEGTFGTYSFLTNMSYGTTRVGTTLMLDETAYEALVTCATAFEEYKTRIEDDWTLVGQSIRAPLLDNAVVSVVKNEDGSFDYTSFLDAAHAYCVARGLAGSRATMIDRYINEWTRDERRTFFTDTLQELAYRSYVLDPENGYRTKTGSDAVAALADVILRQKGITLTTVTKTAILYERPEDVSPLEAINEQRRVIYNTDAVVATDRAAKTLTEHELVMTVIDYLCGNMEYTKRPSEMPENTAYGNVLETFLFETKEGYCVHFATAAAALLREYGLPARYCEGAIVTSFSTNRTNGAQDYAAKVSDRNLHAWIEVYYDGLGWVQYECTPTYYEKMYGAKDRPVNPRDSEETTEPVTEPEPESTETEFVEPPVPEDAIPWMWIGIGCGCFLLGVLVLLFIYHRNKVAAANLRRRASLVAKAKNEATFEDGTDTRALTREITDDLFNIFASLGIEPEPGENADAFGARLNEEYGTLSPVDPCEAMRCVQKEEFGSGLAPAELATLASYLETFADGAYNELDRRQKRYMRFWKHIL